MLESLVNKRLIMNHCAKRGITVTNEEIAAEIDRMAKRFQLGREQWLEMLEKERGVIAAGIRPRHRVADARPAEAGRRRSCR